MSCRHPVPYAVDLGSALRRGAMCLALCLAVASCSKPADSGAKARSAPPGGGALTTPVGEPVAHHVGVEACRACHLERVASYVETNHFKTLRLPAAGAMAGRFEAGKNELHTRNPHLRFELTHGDAGHSLTAIAGAPGSEVRTTKSIDLVIGSGKLFEGYLHFEGDALVQLPVGFSGAQDDWINCPGYRDGEADFTRPVKPRCLDCHGTWFEHVAGSTNRYVRERTIVGLSCERCHGPGSRHVDWHKTHPDDAVARYVVRPKELSRQGRLEQCGQCHGDPGVLLAPAFTYVPGRPLAEYVKQSTSQETVFVHTANQVQRLEASACFKKSDRLECITCHDPHVDESALIVGRALEACASCHRDEACVAAPSLPEGLRGACIDCHMPRRSDVSTTFSTATDDHVDLVRMTEHTIGRHSEESETRRIKWSFDHGDPREKEAAQVAAGILVDRLAAKATDLLDRRRFVESLVAWRQAGRLLENAPTVVKGLQATRRAQARSAEADVLCAEAFRRLEVGDRPRAIESLRQAVAIDPEHGDATFNLGLLVLEDGQAAAALGLFEVAAETMSEQAELQNGIGSALLRLGRLAAAEARFAAALTRDDSLVKAHYNLARLLLGRGEAEKALGHLRRVVAAEPDDVEFRHHLAMSLAATARLDEAVTHLEQVLARAPERVDSLCMMAELLGASGRFEPAAELVRKATELAPHDPRPYRSHAALLRRQGRLDEALAAFTDSLVRDPAQFEVLSWIAELHAQLGRSRDAVASAEEACRVAEESGRADLLPALRARVAEFRRLTGR